MSSYLLHSIITPEESWVLRWDSEKLYQSLVIHKQFVLEEKKVQVLEKVLKQVWRVGLQFRGKASWLLLQDHFSSCCHDSEVLSGDLQFSGDQAAPYSADFAPTDCFLK